MLSTTHGVFPFGEPVLEIRQVDDGRPRRVFILGVYASAVHACWRDPNGKLIVRALAVASEPCIFWTGEGADEIIRRIPIPQELGSLSPAGAQLNGPSGKALDRHILQPLKLTRSDAWLCDLRPWSCSNEGQLDAICRYHERIKGTSLPKATVEKASDAEGKWADDARRAEILSELRHSQAQILITLGDQPLKHFVHPIAGQHAQLSALTYGQLTPITLDGLTLQLLPLAHPRQIARLGAHSPTWARQHEDWARNTAPDLSVQ